MNNLAKLDHNSNWVLIAPSGTLAIAREPQQSIPHGCRIATGAELLAANRGNPFPWGNLPEPHANNRQWREQFLGVGGLIHERWFMTTQGRFGGARNVQQTLPASLRSCMLIDGGGDPKDALLDNEGYAVVRETSARDQDFYRAVQLYAAKNVMADGGAIVCSPLDENNHAYVGFVGRCQICPNLELISFPQLQKTLSPYKFTLWPEWQKWSLGVERAATGTLKVAA
jgi:hypothetical protein